MEKGQTPAHAEDQHGQIAGLDLPFANGEVAVSGSVVDEFACFLIFLRVALHHFDAAHRLGQPGVHDAERVPQSFAGRSQPAGVVADGDDEKEDEDGRNQQQARVDLADEDKRRDQPNQRVRDEHQPGAEHHVQRANVIGGTGHDVADSLAIVEGLALAEQADVELVPAVALHPLGHEFEGRITHQPEQPLHGRRGEDRQGQQEERACRPVGRIEQVESAADEHLDVTGGKVVDQRGQHGRRRQPRILRQLGKDPSRRAAAVEVVFVGQSEFAMGHSGTSLSNIRSSKYIVPGAPFEARTEPIIATPSPNQKQMQG